MSKSQQEDAFVIASQLLSLQRHTTALAESRLDSALSMQAIVDTVLFPQRDLSQVRLQRINKNLHSRRLYSQALKSLSFLHSPSQIAASSALESNLLMSRAGEGFSVKFVKDPDDSQQAFLLLRLHEEKYEELAQSLGDDKDLTSGLFLHCEWQTEFFFVHLQRGAENSFQTIISREQSVFAALCQLDCQLYLSQVPNT